MADGLSRHRYRDVTAVIVPDPMGRERAYSSGAQASHSIGSAQCRFDAGALQMCRVCIRYSQDSALIEFKDFNRRMAESDPRCGVGMLLPTSSIKALAIALRTVQVVEQYDSMGVSMTLSAVVRRTVLYQRGSLVP